MTTATTVDPRNSLIPGKALIFRAPAGTTPPTKLNDVLDVAFQFVGATGDKGVGLNWKETLKQHYNHQSAEPYKVSKTAREVSVDILLNEQSTLSRQIAYGGGSAIGSSDPDAGVRFQLSDAGTVDEGVYVFDFFEDGIHERWVVRRGVAGGDVKTNFERDEIAQLPVNIACLTDGSHPAWEPIGNQPGMISTAAVTSVTRSPASKTLAVGETQQATATAVFEDGFQLDVTNLADWVSSAESKATVDEHGLITAVASGTSNVTAAYGGQTSTAIAVTVS